MGDNEQPQEFVLYSLPKMYWVTPVKNVAHFQFWHVGYEMFADFNFSNIEDEEKKNKSVKTSLVLAAQKGDFQQMVMDIQKLDQAGHRGFDLFAQLKRQSNKNVAVEKNAECQKYRGLERKQREELDDAVNRQGRQILSSLPLSLPPSPSLPLSPLFSLSPSRSPTLPPPLSLSPSVRLSVLSVCLFLSFFLFSTFPSLSGVPERYQCYQRVGYDPPNTEKKETIEQLMIEGEFDQVLTAAIVIKIILSLFGIKSSMFGDAVSVSTRTTGGLSSVFSPCFGSSPSASSRQQVQIAADPQIKMKDINYDGISYELLATLAKTIGLVKKLRKVTKRGHRQSERDGASRVKERENAQQAAKRGRSPSRGGQNSSSRSRSRPPPQSCSTSKKGNCPNYGLEHGSKVEDCYAFEKKCNYEPCGKKGHFERMCCKKKADEGKAGGSRSSSSSSN